MHIDGRMPRRSRSASAALGIVFACGSLVPALATAQAAPAPTSPSAPTSTTVPAPAPAPAPGAAPDPATLCETRPENRQLDFWIGEWDVLADGQKVAQSSIQRFAGSCSVLESYAQPDGYSGKSINFYDATLRKWRQTWVDKAGTVSEFSGSLRDGAMELEGETHARSGTVVLRRMTVRPLAVDRVRQSSERSLDSGRTWQKAYDFEYVRKK